MTVGFGQDHDLPSKS